MHTKVFLKKRFKDYYWRSRVEAPPEVASREFGVGTLEDKIKFRHKSFQSEKELSDYLKTEAPYYISYSAAYYEFPKNQPIQSKNWRGADLIFDLDMPMPLLDAGRMQKVKDEALVLLDFLKTDFGFPSQDIRINFSGGKGYHIHVISERVRSLGGDERRELVDYVTGTGLSIDTFIHPVDSAEGLVFVRGKPKVSAARWAGPTKDSRGWARRIYDVTRKLITSSREELVEMEGIGPKTAEKIVENRERNIRLLEAGQWEALLSQFRSNIQKQILRNSVEITDDDKMVSIDTSRLIRLPDTIHGGSGLLAKRVRDFDSFNPLVDAIAFSGGGMRFRVVADTGKFDLNDTTFGPYKAGSEATAPECAAIYLMLKGNAEAVA